jgi:hypothetical protein
VQSGQGRSRDDLRGARQLARATALQPCIRRIAEIRTHDALMRIGSGAPGGGPILNHGWRAMFGVGLPPPRIIIGGLRSSVVGRRSLIASLSSGSRRRA